MKETTRDGEGCMFRHCLSTVAALVMAASSAAWADESSYFEPGQCSLSQSVVNNVLDQLASVVKLKNGGLFSPNLMWAAVVDRQGVLCGVTRSDPDAWPGSRDIAIAKATPLTGSVIVSLPSRLRTSTGRHSRVAHCTG